MKSSAEQGSAVLSGGGKRYIPGQVLVEFRRGTGAGAMTEACREAGLSSVARTVRSRGGEKARLYMLKPGVSVEEAVRTLRRRPEVAFAEPNYLRRTTYFPDDSRFGEQWGFHNTGQEIQGSLGVPDADIDAVEAWDLVNDLGNTPTVAVIDSGVDLNHPDLVDMLWVNTGERPGNGVDDDANGYVDDLQGWNWTGFPISFITTTPGGWGMMRTTSSLPSPS